MRLSSLIDLVALMHRDRDVDSDRLRRRDAVIGADIDADQLSDAEALTAWVLHQNKSQKVTANSSVGKQAQGMLQLTQVGLGISGFLCGASAMASALAFDTHTNIIPLWSVLVGLQIVLLGLWLLAILPTHWIFWFPGASGFQRCVRFIGRVPIRILVQVQRWCSPAIRNQMRSLGGELKRVRTLYGDLTRWIGMQLTQIFALAFNLGLVIAFLALSYGNDPTFGWRSTMLSSTQMHQIMQVISWPWSSVWPDAVPTLEVVSYVKDSSKENITLTLDPEQRMRDLRMWASLWPFLLASLCFYGVLPRVLTLAVSLFQVRRHLNPEQQYSLAVRTLLNRLRRTRVVLESDSSVQDRPTSREDGLVPASDWHTVAPLPVFQWSGVPLDSVAVADNLRSRFGAEMAFCERVGELDPKQDDAVLGRLSKEKSGERVVVLIEGWESPDADYLDFLYRLRHCIAPNTEISVVLCSPKDVSVESEPTAAVNEIAAAEKIWRTFLMRCGDPGLSVTTMRYVERSRSVGR